MSSAAGGSGIGDRSKQVFSVLDGGQVQLEGGQQVDITTVDGLKQAQAVLSVEQLAELESLMSGLGFKLVDQRFVPTDAYGKAAVASDQGPTSTAAGLSALDADLVQHVFVDSGIPSPYNANTTPRLGAEMQGTPQMTAATAALGEHLANPSAASLSNFQARFAELRATFPHGNIMETLFLVFRESIQETNQDKKYFLLKLQEYNTMAEDLSKYLEQLVEDSQRLAAASQGQKYPEKVFIPVTARTFDLAALDGTTGHLISRDSTKSMDRAALNDTIKNVESMQETVRNKRQMASTAFQNFDQKSNQLYNLMSSVLKSMGEMRSSTIRNML